MRPSVRAIVQQIIALACEDTRPGRTRDQIVRDALDAKAPRPVVTYVDGLAQDDKIAVQALVFLGQELASGSARSLEEIRQGLSSDHAAETITSKNLGRFLPIALDAVPGNMNWLRAV